jgi:hypothetical protein
VRFEAAGRQEEAFAAYLFERRRHLLRGLAVGHRGVAAFYRAPGRAALGAGCTGGLDAQTEFELSPTLSLRAAFSGVPQAGPFGCQCGTLQLAGSSSPPWKILLNPLVV